MLELVPEGWVMVRSKEQVIWVMITPSLSVGPTIQKEILIRTYAKYDVYGVGKLPIFDSQKLCFELLYFESSSTKYIFFHIGFIHLE